MNKVSILGDSISVVESFSNAYPYEYSKEKTWWYPTLEAMGWTLEKLCARHGNTVQDKDDNGAQFTQYLDKLGEPDIILMEMGTCDWNRRNKKSPLGMHIINNSAKNFEAKLICLLDEIASRYPTAKLIQVNSPRIEMGKYKDIINKVCEDKKIPVVSMGLLDDTLLNKDGYHPNKDGMKIISERLIPQLREICL